MNFNYGPGLIPAVNNPINNSMPINNPISNMSQDEKIQFVK